MSRSSRAGRRSAPQGQRIKRHKAERSRTLGQTVGLTLLSALIPGLGLLMGGRRRLGAAVMSVTFGLLGLAVVIVATRRDEVFHLVALTIILSIVAHSSTDILVARSIEQVDLTPEPQKT